MNENIKLGWWYWFNYVYVWLLLLLIPTVIILFLIDTIDSMLLIRAGWIIPVGLWYGSTQIKKEKNKYLQKILENKYKDIIK